MTRHGVRVDAIQSAELPADFGGELLGLDLARNRRPFAVVVRTIPGCRITVSARAESASLGSRRSPVPVAVSVVAHSYLRLELRQYFPTKGYGLGVTVSAALATAGGRATTMSPANHCPVIDIGCGVSRLCRHIA